MYLLGRIFIGGKEDLFEFEKSNLNFEIQIEIWWAYYSDLHDHVDPKTFQNYEV